MAAKTTLDLHQQADQYAAKGDFEGALRCSAEALLLAPIDSRARLKVALCLAAFGRPERAVSALKVAADMLLRRGHALFAIGACRDALGIQPGAPEIKAALERIHDRIFGLEGRGRPRVPPPAPPMPLEKGPESLLDLKDRQVLLDRAEALALADPEKDAPPVEVAPVPLFSDLSKQAFLSIAEKMAYLKVPSGHTIVREGEEGQSLFILVQGEVVVARASADGGPEQVMAKLGAGSLFGELALIRAKPRQATVRTTQPSELFEIARPAVESVAAAHPALTEDLVRFARRRLIMNLMATSKIFHPFDDAQRLQILRAFVSRPVEPGTVIIEEGKPPTGLYLLLEGEVEVSKLDEGKEKVVLAYLREGEVFGEIALLEKKMTTATVTAADKSVLLYLDGVRFNDFLREHPKIEEYLSSLSDARQEEIKQAMSSEGVVLEADDLIIL
jgi:CRP-like cAMP-binding protein